MTVIKAVKGKGLCSTKTQILYVCTFLKIHFETLNRTTIWFNSAFKSRKFPKVRSCAALITNWNKKWKTFEKLCNLAQWNQETRGCCKKKKGLFSFIWKYTKKAHLLRETELAGKLWSSCSWNTPAWLCGNEATVDRFCRCSCIRHQTAQSAEVNISGGDKSRRSHDVVALPGEDGNKTRGKRTLGKRRRWSVKRRGYEGITWACDCGGASAFLCDGGFHLTD